MPPSLAERLRLETRDLHTRAERTGVMADLLHGRIARGAYVALLRNLHSVYAALESQPGTRAWVPAVLHRTAALAHDLDTLAGAGWARALPQQPAALRYAARLQALGTAGSPALAAHAYVRYLGDLHGGQALKRLVALHLALPAGSGVSFYEFGDDAALQALRADFRRALASLPLQPGEADLIVAEARWAFGQHIALFTELAA